MPIKLHRHTHRWHEVSNPRPPRVGSTVWLRSGPYGDGLQAVDIRELTEFEAMMMRHGLRLAYHRPQGNSWEVYKVIREDPAWSDPDHPAYGELIVY